MKIAQLKYSAVPFVTLVAVLMIGTPEASAKKKKAFCEDVPDTQEKVAQEVSTVVAQKYKKHKDASIGAPQAIPVAQGAPKGKVKQSLDMFSGGVDSIMKKKSSICTARKVKAVAMEAELADLVKPEKLLNQDESFEEMDRKLKAAEDHYVAEKKELEDFRKKDWSDAFVSEGYENSKSLIKSACLDLKGAPEKHIYDAYCVSKMLEREIDIGWEKKPRKKGKIPELLVEFDEEKRKIDEVIGAIAAQRVKIREARKPASVRNR